MTLKKRNVYILHVFLAQARPILVWPEFSWIPVINGL
ncbi:hypothetical protein LEP1GSC079_0073, partial [Leptospira interrogans str. FPW1039]